MEQMNLSEIQKRALAKVMMEIIVADDDIDDREVDFLDKVQTTLSISVEDIQHSTAMELELCMSILSEMSETEKRGLGLLFSEMVDADGQADLKEEEMLKRLLEDAGITWSR